MALAHVALARHGVQIARLYLVSDILHNSSAPIKNASHYRTAFSQVLPLVFQVGQSRQHATVDIQQTTCTAWLTVCAPSSPALRHDNMHTWQSTAASQSALY